MAIFTGAGVAIITPFHEDGSVNFEKFAEGVFDMTASPVQGGALLPSALRAATSLPEGGKGGTAPSVSLCKTENAPVPLALPRRWLAKISSI